MKIQLKRSNVLDGSTAKEPTAAQMEYGELAVNYNNGDPVIFMKDSSDAIIRIAGAGAPGGGGGDGEGRPDRAVDLLHADGTSTPECVDEKFRGRVIVRTDDRDQVMHPQSSCWRRKRSNSAARSSALGILDSARRS